jgi:DNA-directed RNA polymerase specialized sigma24 family protein
VEHCSYEEIGKRMSITPANARKRVERAPSALDRIEDKRKFAGKNL